MAKYCASFIVLSLALGGCGQPSGGGQQNNAAASGSVANESNAQLLKADRAVCAPAPTMDRLPEFGEASFAPGSPAFGSTAQNFATAYERSCPAGLIGDFAWTRVFLKNAPDANVPSIYGREEGGDLSSREVILEGPFINAEGQSSVPTSDELAEAIYCAVRGATPQEQEEEGRCLPD